MGESLKEHEVKSLSPYKLGFSAGRLCNFGNWVYKAGKQLGQNVIREVIIPLSLALSKNSCPYSAVVNGDDFNAFQYIRYLRL